MRMAAILDRLAPYLALIGLLFLAWFPVATFRGRHLELTAEGQLYEVRTTWRIETGRSRLRLQNLDRWRNGQAPDEPTGLSWFCQDSDGTWHPVVFSD